MPAGLVHGNNWEDDRECPAYGLTDEGREVAKRLPQRDYRPIAAPGIRPVEGIDHV